MKTTLTVVLCGTLKDAEKRMYLDFERLYRTYPKARKVMCNHTIEVNEIFVNKYISIRQLKNYDGFKPRYMEADVSVFLTATPEQMKSIAEWYKSAVAYMR